MMGCGETKTSYGLQISPVRWEENKKVSRVSARSLFFGSRGVHALARREGSSSGCLCCPHSLSLLQSHVVAALSHNVLEERRSVSATAV